MRDKWLIVFLLFLTSFLYAQTNNNEERFTRRIVWRGGANAFRYAVEIDRLEPRGYRSYLREYTTALYVDVTLPLGEYRFRIIPYDILDRPAEGTAWMHFEIRPPVRNDNNPIENEQMLIISADDYITETEPQDIPVREAQWEAPRIARFNTLGVSFGTTFADPLVTATIHGTYAPIRSLENIFLELGCEFGFVSIFDDVTSLYCINPFAHIGYFIPFRNEGGLFAGIGGGYMLGAYTFSYGKADINYLVANMTVGINIFDFLNISYTFKTNFDFLFKSEPADPIPGLRPGPTDRSVNNNGRRGGGASSKVSVGYVYRF